jgi:hypothetical protein
VLFLAGRSSHLGHHSQQVVVHRAVSLMIVARIPADT